MGLFSRALTPEAFAIDYVRAAAAHHPGASFEALADDYGVRITFADERVVSVDLSNSYSIASGLAKGERPEFIARLAKGAYPQQVPSNFAEAAGLIRPAIRTTDWIARYSGLGSAPIHVERSPHVFVTYVLDFPDSMTPVTAAQIADWGVTEEDVLDTARTNLRAMTFDYDGNLDAGVIQVIGEDGHSAAALMVNYDHTVSATWDPVGVPVGRDQFFLLNTLDPDKLAANLAQCFMVWRQDPHKISPLPYKHMAEWNPPPGHPANELLASIREEFYSSSQGSEGLAKV